MSSDGRHIVGSAEPLTPEQTEARLRELEAWGVDLSLVWANLQLSPAQRLDLMLDRLALVEQLRRAWREQNVRAVPEMLRSAPQENTQT